MLENILASFINANSPKEIIFTKGTTESINLVASIMTDWIKPNDEIIISTMEHHSNLVPWQHLCKKQNAQLKVVPTDDNDCFDIDRLKRNNKPFYKVN